MFVNASLTVLTVTLIDNFTIKNYSFLLWFFINNIFYNLFDHTHQQKKNI